MVEGLVAEQSTRVDSCAQLPLLTQLDAKPMSLYLFNNVINALTKKDTPPSYMKVVILFRS